MLIGHTNKIRYENISALDIIAGAPAIDTMSYLAKEQGYKEMISAIDKEDLESVSAGSASCKRLIPVSRIRLQ